MRAFTAFGLAFLATGCGREPATGEQPSAKGDPCPKSATATAADAPIVIADGIQVVRSQMPLRWGAADGHLYELGADPRAPKDLGAIAGFKGPVWDDKYWYRATCYENCESRTSMGIPHAVERIDRATGESKRLGKGDYGLNSILPFGEHVYWGVYGHQIGGGVSRVSKDGGEQEEIRIAAKPHEEDKVADLIAYPDGILVQGTETLAWIPASGDRPRLILRVDRRMGSAVRDGDAFYVAEQGDPYWQAQDSGYIHRVSADGRDTKLAGPIRWPSAIATFGPNVYFMLRQSSDIWSVPKQGGKPTRVLTDGPRIQDCDESQGLWADERGLFWLRGDATPFSPVASRLYFQSWTGLGMTR